VVSQPSLVARGKVRDVYCLDEHTLLLVASDRVSAFDVVMAEAIPDKGRVLTATSAFWFAHLAGVAPSHLLSVEVPAGLGAELDPSQLVGRVMVARRAEMLPLECIVRGYLAGSAWAEYRETGRVHGLGMPSGLRLGDPLPEAVFTPSTKATSGHDRNLTFDEAVALVGGQLAEAAREISLELYRRAASWTAERGIVVADTKFELGLIDGQLAVCDELLTPDSSRFWPSGGWEPGSAPPAYDKQPLRDWLEASGWDKAPPPPPLPPGVVAETAARYREAYERVSGRRLADWPGASR